MSASTERRYAAGVVWRIIIALTVWACLMQLALADPGDYELRIAGQQPVCAKSVRMCEEARDAIRAGRYRIAAPDAETRCVAAPGCFSYESNTIRGFNR